MHASEGAIAMRRVLWITATAAILAFPASALCQQQGEHAAQPPPPTTLEKQKEGPKPPPPPAAAQGQAQPPAATSIPPNPPKESLGEAARRSREQKRDAGKSGKVFTNDNLPTGGVSTVGVLSLDPGKGIAEMAPAVAGENATPNDEKTWRARFAKLRDKLAKDQAELEVMQRELGVLDLQAYDDPVKALQQNLTRSDINAKTAKIEEKKKQIEEDQQALSDAEDQLRKSGGDAGWAR
jgi:hypothetical protein